MNFDLKEVGGSLGPLFELPEDPSRFWVLIAIFSAATIFICLGVLIRGRAPTEIRTAGLLLLPIFTYVLGDLWLMEASKNVEFCGSCHATMSPVVTDMKTGELPGSLAAFHYQRGAVSATEACYQCHSGYGLWGDFDAKIAGVAHMLVTVTETYTFPLTHSGSFDVDSCLGCHSQSRPFREAQAHHDPILQAALVSGGISCAGSCHAPAHTAASLLGAEGAP